MHKELTQDYFFSDIQEIIAQIKEETRVFIKKYICN